jgi:hypothetical protein
LFDFASHIDRRWRPTIAEVRYGFTVPAPR